MLVKEGAGKGVVTPSIPSLDLPVFFYVFYTEGRNRFTL